MFRLSLVFQWKESSIARVINFFAMRTASFSGRPSAKFAAIDAEYVQPVPCVEPPFRYGSENSCTPSTSINKSTA